MTTIVMVMICMIDELTPFFRPNMSSIIELRLCFKQNIDMIKPNILCFNINMSYFIETSHIVKQIKA